MERISKEEERKLMLKYLTEKCNNVYPFLYEPLKWRHESWQELSPEQVWQEAITLSDKIRNVNVPKFEMPYIIEELKERTEGERNADFLIMLAAAYRLAPLTTTDDKVKKATVYIVAHLIEHPLYEVMKLRVSVCENDEDLQDYRINVLEYQLEQADVKDNNSESRIKEINSQVDIVLKMEPKSMLVFEVLLSRLNDKSGHIYDTPLERLRAASDAKVASETEPRRIGQVIARQNNLGDVSGLEGLLEKKKLEKLLSSI